MKLVVGLGNPGTKYLMNRHNIGFMVVDALAQRHSATQFKQEHKSLTTKIRQGTTTALLAKPQTFMNLSGEPVQKLVSYYDILPQDELLVIQDDVDQGFGAIRFQKDRGHGGHNGIRDIHDKLGTTKYLRLKLGVGRPSNPKMEVADYVLQDFSQQEQAEMPDYLDDCCQALEVFLTDGYEKAATRFNRKALSWD